MTVGRNDPCPCGSGQKYKKCCLPKQSVISLQAVRAERNHEVTLDRLLELAAALPPADAMADGIFRFFGAPPPEQPTDEEYSEPLDWVLFGYRSPATGTTLAGRVARETRGLSEQEREQMLAWAHGAIPGFFHVTHPGPGEVHLRRLWDATPAYVVSDKGDGLRTGDLLMAWLLPGPIGLRFGYHQALLPPEATRPLEHLLREELTLLRRQRPDATWDDLYRECWPRLVVAGAFAATIGEQALQMRVAGRPQVQGGPQPNPAWEMMAERFAEVLKDAGARPEEVAGGLRLWWDAVHVLKPRISRMAPWLGALVYLLSNRVYGSEETQAEIAATMGTTAASLGSRAREIASALGLSDGDARYADLLDPMLRAVQRIELMHAGGELNPLLHEAMREVEEADPFDLPWEDSWEGRAEELIDQAWGAKGKRRVKLAQQAIDLWPDAADAYVILGHAARERGDVGEAVRLYQAGVQAGERALGKAFFAENVGHFWGLVESRPYMRARAGLADALWSQGEHEAAIGHFQELLRLNPGDNQGIRYLLAARLVELGDDRRLERLLKAHEDEASATMLFTAALLAFRQKGPGKEANARLREACQYNPHVPAYLLGRRPLPGEPPQYIGFGDESEAEAYALDFIGGWTATPGALQWLASRT